MNKNIYVPYESPIWGQLFDLISPTKINLFEPRFKSYDLWDMANCLPWFYLRILEVRILYCKKTKNEFVFFVSRTQEPEYINEYGPVIRMGIYCEVHKVFGRAGARTTIISNNLYNSSYSKRHWPDSNQGPWGQKFDALTTLPTIIHWIVSKQTNNLKSNSSPLRSMIFQ